MTPEDYDDFCKVVVGFAALKGRSLPPEAIELYWHTMQDWGIEDFKHAAEQLLRTCQWMPTPKEFEDLRKAARPVAAEAWITARKNAGTAIICGQVTSGKSCGEELIDRAVAAIGGYGAIAMCETSKLGFLERRFTEHYGELQDVHETRQAVPQIASERSKIMLPRVKSGS